MSSDSVRVRFAPSPTGYLHVGGARTALYNWLFARHCGGKFILRIEDTDRTRYVPDSLPDLMAGLCWLGLYWDEGPEVGGDYGPYFQSDRLPFYQKYCDQLVAEGKAYRCYCTPERLDAMREEQRVNKQPPGYDRHCRFLTQKQIAEYEAEGCPWVVRLAIPTEGATEYDDLFRGHIAVDNQQLDDLVLLKSDGFPTYHLANVIDDHLMGITHIMRGDEWLASVPKHVLLYQAFGWQVPVQAHLPTILDPSGKGKLSKRKKRIPGEPEMLTYVHEFKEAGYLPEALFNFLALVGWSYDGQTEYFNQSRLVEVFDLERVNKSPAAFSYEKLDHMNAEYIRSLGMNDLAGRMLQELLANGIKADLATVLDLEPLVRERMRTLKDLVPLVDTFFVDELDYDPQLLIGKKMDRESTLNMLAQAKACLSEVELFEEETIEEALRNQASVLDMGAGKFFAPIRVAVTGKTVSPPMFGTLKILGKERSLARLDAAYEKLSQS